MRARGWVGAVFVSLLGSAALAAPVLLPQSIATGLGSTEWFVDDLGGTNGGPFGGGCDASQALAIADAVSGSGAGDAYDFAWSVWVDGNPFVAPPTVDLTGTALLAGPVVLSGLNVWVQYFFPPPIRRRGFWSGFRIPARPG